MKLTVIAVYFALTDFLFGFINAQSQCDPTREFTCDDGTCIAIYDRCDGTIQCDDQSDEKNCQMKDVKYQNLPRQEDMRGEHRVEANKPQVLPSAPPPPSSSGTLLASSFKWVTIISTMLMIGSFAIWVGLKHVRNKRPRGIRSGDIIDEDEDDLLISSMYSA